MMSESEWALITLMHKMHRKAAKSALSRSTVCDYLVGRRFYLLQEPAWKNGCVASGPPRHKISVAPSSIPVVRCDIYAPHEHLDSGQSRRSSDIPHINRRLSGTNRRLPTQIHPADRLDRTYRRIFLGLFSNALTQESMGADHPKCLP